MAMDDSELYPLGSEVALATAAAEGLTVVTPGPDELQLDLDSDAQEWMFIENMSTLGNIIKVVSHKVTASRGGNKHVTVKLGERVQSDMERILLQACLGSDGRRELLSYARLLKRDPHPTLFLEEVPK